MGGRGRAIFFFSQVGNGMARANKKRERTRGMGDKSHFCICWYTSRDYGLKEEGTKGSHKSGGTCQAFVSSSSLILFSFSLSPFQTLGYMYNGHLLIRYELRGRREGGRHRHQEGMIERKRCCYGGKGGIPAGEAGFL